MIFILKFGIISTVEIRITLQHIKHMFLLKGILIYR